MNKERDDFMFNKKKLLALLVSIMMFSIMFTGCQSTEEPKKETEVKETVVEDTTKDKKDEKTVEDLSSWDGTWNNMGAYLEDEEVQDAYEELAKEENMTPEEAKKEYVEKRQSNFDGLVVKGNKITFLDGFEDKDGKEIETVEYEFKETKKIPGGETEWNIFESKEDGEYKILAMMVPVLDEPLTHFHMRYGKDLDEILAKEGWYPTFVTPDSTYDQLSGEIAG